MYTSFMPMPLVISRSRLRPTLGDLRRLSHGEQSSGTQEDKQTNEWPHEHPAVVFSLGIDKRLAGIASAYQASALRIALSNEASSETAVPASV